MKSTGILLNVKKFSIQKHKKMAWICGVFLFLFVFTGILHPLMSWTGPKAAQYMPPKAQFNLEEIQAFKRQMITLHGREVVSAQLVPWKDGSLIQITEDQMSPRIYMNPLNGQALVNYDQTYAAWLASYYTGLDESKIQRIQLQTQFDAAYPSVNRLLPVYKIQFESDDKKIAYIYTELGALAGLTNDWKTSLQTVFSWFHSWSFLSNILGVDFSFLGTLFAISAVLLLTTTGVGMMFFIKRKKPVFHQKAHRRLGVVLCAPLLAWSMSGMYHLLEKEFSDDLVHLQAPKPFKIDVLHSKSQAFEAIVSKHDTFNTIALIEGPASQLYFRFSASPDVTKPIDRQQRYAGVPSETKSWYINAQKDTRLSLTEEGFAQFLLLNNTEISADQISHIEKITRFGNGYDFRNKRLPVFRIDLKEGVYKSIYIENRSGFLVDRLTQSDKIQGFIFSNLHKWNWLTPFTGRLYRDILMVLFLLGIMTLSLFGVIGLFRNQSRNE